MWNAPAPALPASIPRLSALHVTIASGLHAREVEAGGGAAAETGPGGGARERAEREGAAAAAERERTAREREEGEGEGCSCRRRRRCPPHADVAPRIIPPSCDTKPDDVTNDDAFTDVTS